MSFTQLNPTIPVYVIGKGPGFALAVIDYGQEHNLIWVTAITETGEIWCAPNPKVRMASNWTMGRPKSKVASEEETMRLAEGNNGGTSEGAGKVTC